MRDKKNGWLAVGGTLVLAGVVVFYWSGDKGSGAVHADTAATTQTAAAQASAKVQPTDPKLKIEPK
ncbi:hypothetical protein [Bradyrhizobium sp.]|uniref:hypothetical protein n=1 Tax=Bradyrhizobium sp. TaxID=376 RepID=UPI0039E317B2